MSTAVPVPAPASRDEALVALNELLEAERAGVRVAMETARDMPPCAWTTLVQDLHQDEVRWCRMLMRTIKALLEVLTARVQDAQLRTDPGAMLEAHRRNIERVDARHA